MPQTDSIFTEFPYINRKSFQIGAQKIKNSLWKWIRKQDKFKNMSPSKFTCVEKYHVLCKNPKIEYYRIYGKNKKYFDNLTTFKKPRLLEESSEDEESFVNAEEEIEAVEVMEDNVNK